MELMSLRILLEIVAVGNIHCAFLQRVYTKEKRQKVSFGQSVADGLCALYLLGVDGALKLGQTISADSGSEEDWLELVHASIGEE